MKKPILNTKRHLVNPNAFHASDEQIRIYITALIAASFTLEAIDAVKNTSLYNQQVRNLGERFCKEIERMLLKNPELWNDTANEVPDLVDHIRQIAHSVSRMQLQNMTVVRAFIDKYKDSPEECEAFLQTKAAEALPEGGSHLV